ncbi:MAG: chemotaxis protein CheW [Pseudomonadota bacterium]|nr:chemotaxis protein CheW [Pseudomonadota bacterium]
MLFLMFHVGQNRYMLDVRQVSEVLPLTGIMPISQAPKGVAGLCSYRGSLIPVLDLSELMLSHPARRRMHTRIVIAQCAHTGGVPHLLGLIVEKMTETVRLEAADFRDSGTVLPQLGAIATDRYGLVQRIDLNQLLPESLRDLLFKQSIAA